MECKQEENKVDCSCSHKDCERNGLCCECVAYHRAKDQLPCCLRYILEKKD